MGQSKEQSPRMLKSKSQSEMRWRFTFRACGLS